ncbi:phosphotransferase [Paenibacillus gorillae]|uniref:phosphotransferase n=1 Tax=Paenibacillus gorillae TaxID=1243662 RepID=UPI0004AD43C3|nr:phosphotransferase [Paenibacillus gorillae]
MMQMVGKKVGEGGCSEVFEWGGGNEQIVKVAKGNTIADAVKREFSNSMLVWENGLPAPRPYEFLEVDGRPSIVMERVHGESLMEHFFRYLMQSPSEIDQTDDNEDVIKITARLLSETHRMNNLPLPSQKEMMVHSIRSAGYLSEFEKVQVIEHLKGLPFKKQVCHGDPNPGNIMVRGDHAVLIDWMNASTGNPEADLAEYIIMIRYAILPPHTPSSAVARFDSLREHIIEVFCEEYRRLSGNSLDEVEDWIMPVAARKLCADAIGEEEKALLLAEIRSRL